MLVSNGEYTTTCIILTPPYDPTDNNDNNFYYSYCLEDGLFGLIYSREIISIVSKNFAPDFEFESELFDTDYSFYADLHDRFAYFPSIFPALKSDCDDNDED